MSRGRGLVAIAAAAVMIAIVAWTNPAAGDGSPPSPAREVTLHTKPTHAGPGTWVDLKYRDRSDRLVTLAPYAILERRKRGAWRPFYQLSSRRYARRQHLDPTIRLHPGDGFTLDAIAPDERDLVKVPRVRADRYRLLKWVSVQRGAENFGRELHAFIRVGD